jgi:hypothetical protein
VPSRVPSPSEETPHPSTEAAGRAAAPAPAPVAPAVPVEKAAAVLPQPPKDAGTTQSARDDYPLGPEK